MNILIPTHPAHFHYNINFLNSFNEKCLDKKDVTITFVLSSESESNHFLSILSQYPFEEMNINLLNLPFLLEYVDHDKNLLAKIHMTTKYPIINFKKMYGCLYLNQDCLVLDSENICTNEFYFENVFNRLKGKYIPYTSFGDSFDDVYYSLEVDIVNNSADILKTENDKWFFTKTYWFYEIEYLKDMFEYIKTINNIDNISLFFGDKIFFDYQLYCNYLYIKKLKEFKSHYEIVSSKQKLIKSFKEYQSKILSEGGVPVGFQYICASLNDECIDEYLEFIKEHEEDIVKIHWMSDNIRNRIIDEGNIAIGSLHL